DLPSGYPAPIDSALDTGSDPIGAQLQTTYGTKDVYGMHWILDVDNFYGYGRRGDGVSQPSYINTFQRGPQESTWETVPHPSWEDFLSGGSSSAGFLPLFISGPTPAQQWRYTNAPDADARLIQAMYWANQFAPGNSTVAALSRKAARMGDFLRYAFFDKYFKTMGCASPQCPAGTGYNAAHFLLSWYYAWGGPIPPQGGWSFRIGSSHNHFGYQNPMAAHALTTVAALRPGAAADPNNQAVVDWRTSLDRQLEFYRWLQSADGGIGGGATNSWGGRYLAPPAGTATFYAMFYQENPVYLDPGSNTWFGFQVWSMERVAEYYHETNNAEAKVILDKWVPWAMGQTRLLTDGTFQVPSTLAWAGQPSLNWNATTQNWNPADTAFNANLRVTVTEWGTDLGVTAALAKTLIYYSAGTRRWATQHTASQTLAKELLDRMWTLYRDDIGVSAPEVRRDYNRFDDPIFVPGSFSGVMANGDPISSTSTFLSIRTGYRSDPNFAQVQAYLDGGPAPSFRYHRFWAQVDVALANAEYGRLFP
ncbi:MAG TPA: glycoside hydrolase family 48 protein, partial [Vicinamibacteria bacterium]